MAGYRCALSEEAQGISEISVGLSQIDQVTQHNAGHAETLASAASELSVQAGRLREQLLRFTV